MREKRDPLLLTEVGDLSLAVLTNKIGLLYNALLLLSIFDPPNPPKKGYGVHTSYQITTSPRITPP
jgi:hypothetical protein